MRIALLLCLATSASAQPADVTTTRARPSWFTFGAGPSTGRDGRDLGGIAFQIVAPTGLGPLVVQGGASIAQSNWLFGGSNENVSDGHVALGVAVQQGPLHIAAVVGPAAVHVVLVEEVADASGRLRRVATARFLPGAVASAQGVVALNRSLGISAEVFGLANADLPTAGFRFGLVVGNL